MCALVITRNINSLKRLSPLFRLFAHYKSKDHPLPFDTKVNIADAINMILQMIETLVEHFYPRSQQ